MDLNDIWQENKRYFTGVLIGGLVFLVGILLIQSLYGDELSQVRRSKARVERQLGEARYGTTERELARSENAALASALDELATAVEFRARDDFRLDPAAGSSVNQYHRSVARVRERLLSRAGRANLFLDANLGLPDLSPAEDEEIARYLDALDAVARITEWAIASGVERVDDVRIRLDPGFGSRKGVGAVERTRVEFEFAGSGLALTRLLRATQRPKEHGLAHTDQPLSIYSLELRPARNRAEKSKLTLSIDLVRLHAAASFAEDSQS